MLENLNEALPINTKTCEKHGIALTEKTIPLGRDKSLRTVEACSICAKEESEKRKMDAEIRLANIKKECHLKIDDGRFSDIPKRFVSAKITDFNETQTYSLDESVLVTGACGTGKTHMAVALAKLAFKTRLDEFNENDFANQRHNKFFTESIFHNFQELSIKIKSSFHSHSGDESMADLLSELMYGFKIIDDVCTSKPTDTAIEALYMITNSRYENMLPTIYTTNLSLAEISTMYGDRIASRLSSCRQIKLTGIDRRLMRAA